MPLNPSEQLGLAEQLALSPRLQHKRQLLVRPASSRVNATAHPEKEMPLFVRTENGLLEKHYERYWGRTARPSHMMTKRDGAFARRAPRPRRRAGGQDQQRCKSPRTIMTVLVWQWAYRREPFSASCVPPPASWLLPPA